MTCVACVVFTILLTSVSGLSLQQCEGGWFTVDESAQSVDAALTCTGIGSSDTVRWMFMTGGTTISIGSCTAPPSMSCSSDINTFSLRRPSGNTSHLSFTQNANLGSRNLVGKTFICLSGDMDNPRSVSCQLHLVYYPSTVSCSVQFNSDVNPWTVSGTCDVTKIYSSRDQYSCQWTQTTGSSSQMISEVTMITTANPDSKYRNAQCSMDNKPFPATDGTYIYTVMTSPGSSSVTAVFTGTNVVRTPTTPVVKNCSPSSYVPELSRLECKCSTDDLGSPAGFVQWSPAFPQQGVDSSRLVIANVSRGDDNHQFRCQVKWNQQTLQPQQPFTVRVAYGPYVDSINITSIDVINNTFDSDGTRDLHVMCSYKDVVPSTAISWLEPNSCRGQGQICTFRPQPPGDITMRCQVTNNENNKKTQTASLIINLNYPPTEAPRITGYSGVPLYVGNTTHLTCTVHGGNPPVTSVAFGCGGQVQTGKGVSLTISMTADSGRNGQTCVCSASWKIPGWYTVTANVTLLVHFPVTSVELTLNSQSGILQVYENQTADVIFRCMASGVPPPNIILSDDQEREVASLVGATDDVTVEESVLTHTMRNVRCENSGVYTCTASNNVGQPVSSTTTLRVLLCDLRILSDSFSSQEDGVPVLTADTEEGELHFQIVTTETPHIASFLFLGAVSTGAGSPPRLGLLSWKCGQTSVAYKSSCVLTASNVTQDWTGYYNVTIATASDTVSFTFLLQMQKRSDTGSTPFPCMSTTTCNHGLWMGAGVGIGLAVLVLVDLGVVVCVWRRQWTLPCTERSPRKPVDDTGVRVVESSVEMSSSDTRNAERDTGPYEELKHSDIGLRSVYSVMGSEPPSTPQTSVNPDDGYEIPIH